MPSPLPPVRVETSDGVATVWLAFPGSPANALSPARLEALDRAVYPLLNSPHLDAIVFRSALPGGFCGGFVPGTLSYLETDADAAGFALAGQRVMDRIAAAGPVTVAFVEGPCVGPGLELALACDVRLAVAGPDSEFAFPDAVAGVPPCWGGPTRLKRLVWRPDLRNGLLTGQSALTAREAQRAGLVDDAFCQRRAKVELRTWLDRIQAGWRPRRSASDTAASLAAERAAFRHALRSPLVAARLRPRDAAVPPLTAPFPEVVAVVSDDPDTLTVPVEAALRGTKGVVVAADPAGIASAITDRFAEVVRRGRATPLEAKQARDRITVSDSPAAVGSAGFVLWDARSRFSHGKLQPHVRPAAVLAVLNGGSPGRGDRSRTVGFEAWAADTVRLTTGPRTAPDALAAVAGWLPRLGVRAVLPPTTVVEVARRAA